MEMNYGNITVVSFKKAASAGESPKETWSWWLQEKEPFLKSLSMLHRLIQ